MKSALLLLNRKRITVKKMFVLIAVVLFLAAAPEPTVRVVDFHSLEIGGTKIELPPMLAATMQTDGVVRIDFIGNLQVCDKITEKMVGLNWRGDPICAPESSAK